MMHFSFEFVDLYVLAKGTYRCINGTLAGPWLGREREREREVVRLLLLPALPSHFALAFILLIDW